MNNFFLNKTYNIQIIFLFLLSIIILTIFKNFINFYLLNNFVKNYYLYYIFYYNILIFYL